MLRDVISFEGHSYQVQNDKIVYKHHDSYETNIEYGYHTAFAYFAEHENERISQQSLTEVIGINIKCGTFSYSEIPKKFDLILGLSGTLETLYQHEK